MTKKDLDTIRTPPTWSDIADRRHVFEPDLIGLNRIQGELDFEGASFRERYEARPTRAIIRAEKEVELLSAWESDGGTMLRAPWRAGKTELVFGAIENNDLHDRFLFINSQDAPYPALRFKSADEFRQMYGVREAVDHVVALRQRLGEEIARDGVAELLHSHIASGGSPFSFVSNERREHSLPPALVALDEIADYAYDLDQLGYLASIADESHIRLCLIVQKAPSLEARYDVAFRDFKGVYLEPLTVGESAQIVRAKGGESGLDFSLHATIEIHRAAGGRPLEVGAIVEACRQATERGRHGATYSRADIDRLVAGDIVHLTTTALEPLITNHIRVYERGITESERALVDRLVGTAFGELVVEAIRSDVEKLQSYGLVGVSRGRVYLNGELFRDAIKKRMTDYRTHNYWQPDEYGNDYI